MNGGTDTNYLFDLAVFLSLLQQLQFIALTENLNSLVSCMKNMLWPFSVFFVQQWILRGPCCVSCCFWVVPMENVVLLVLGVPVWPSSRVEHVPPEAPCGFLTAL